MPPFITFLLKYPDVPAIVLLMAGSLYYLRTHRSDKRINWFLIALTLAVPCHALSLHSAKWATDLRPYKFDLYVYNIDSLLGFQPSFLLGQAVESSLFLKVILSLTYNLLPEAIVVLFAGYLLFRPDREALRLIPVFVTNLTLSIPCYLLFPVCGPVYAFANYPALPTGPVLSHLALVPGLANGMPSIHFSTALLILWYARKLPFGTWFGGAYLLLTAAATMGFGEHYFFDLVMAVPYAAFVSVLGQRITFPKLAFSLPLKEKRLTPVISRRGI